MTSMKSLIGTSSTKKINHPHVSYSKLGKISCIICGIQIKSEIAWNAHVLTKSHLLNSEKNKKDLKRPAPAVLKKSSEKKKKVSFAEEPIIEAKIPKVKENNKPEVQEEKEKDAIPEGFFDDPHKDAQARQVPYRDKMADELALFKKEMDILERKTEAEEEKIEEEVISHRYLEELDSQMDCWNKVKNLEISKSSLVERIINQKVEETVIKEDESSDEDFDLGEINDFRSKRVIK